MNKILIFLVLIGDMKNLKQYIVLIFIGLLIFQFSFIFLMNVYDIQFTNSKYFSSQAMSYRLKETLIPASRGNIYDSNLNPLVTNTRGFNLGVVPSKLKNKDEISEILSVLLNDDKNKIMNKLVNKDTYFYLKRNLEFDLGLEIQSWQIDGLVLEETTNRVIHEESLRRIIGKVDPDGNGIEGVELYFNSSLKGKDGKRTYESAPNGKMIPQASIKTQEVIHGNDLILTINSELQYKATELCKEAIIQTNSMNCSIVFADAKNGEILVLTEARNEKIPNISTELINLRAQYEPGSSLKIFTIGSVIQKDLSSMTELYTVPYLIEIIEGSCKEGFKEGGCFKDFKKHEDYFIDLTEIIERSSNVGTILATQNMTINEIESYLKMYGFMKKTGIELTGELAGRTSNNKTCLTCLPSLSIGYSIDVTQLQMVKAYSIIANGGENINLTLNKQRNLDVNNSYNVISTEHSEILKDLLFNVVNGENGTARSLKLLPYLTGGKTGTSRTHIEGEGYSNELYNTSFVGFSELEEQTIVGSVILWGASINPYSEYVTGGSTAAPIYKEMIEYIASIGN